MTKAADERGPGGRSRQLMIIGILFALVVSILALAYFMFLRADYVVLAQGMRPGDAAAVVQELEKRGTPYRLRDGGTTILVPEDAADATRVSLAGSDVAARGEIGFELFNKSDMGLTNFAQKINFQRALQGELVRTITAMDGVESARVHLALPERTLFRGDRAEPKAAVTIAMKPGQVADPSRVAGIQQLVAAAVPDLPRDQVVVLDSLGRVISPAASESTAEVQPADIEEKAAVENYYRARARGAVERQLPGQKFLVRALAVPAGLAAPEPGPARDASWTPSGEGAQRNFRIRLMIVTTAALAAEEQALLRPALAQATGLDEGSGDSIAFEVGPISQPVAPPIDRAPALSPAAPPAQAPPAPITAPLVSGDTLLITLAALGTALLIAALLIRRRARLAPAEQDAFADRLKRQLSLERKDADAAA